MAGQSMTVREAMDRVLGAERDAEQELEASRREAAEIVAAARSRARLIQEAGERRAGHVHRLVNRSLAARIRELRREAAEESASYDYAQEHSLAVARAASELARRLTSHED